MTDSTENKSAEADLAASEEKLREVLEASPMPMAINNDRQEITYLNPAFTETFGYTQADIPTLGQWWAKAYPEPEYQKWVIETWQTRLKDSRQDKAAFPPMEVRLRCKNGSSRTVLASAASSLNSFKGSHFVVLVDITQRKQAEDSVRESERRYRLLTDSLRESEERYRAVSEYSNNAICVVDEAARIVWINDRMLAMGGYSREEYLAAASFAGFIAPESLEFVVSNFGKFLAGEPYEHHYIFSFVAKNGEKRVCEKYMTDYRDRHGKLNLVISMLDTTDKLRLESQLLQSQKMEAVGMLAGGIAHDFNNILTAIKGYCALVTNSLLPEDPNREDMGEIMSAADRASTLTRQLLAFSRKQIMAPKVVDLNRTLSDMVKMLRRVIGEDIKLSTRLFSAPCLARVDPGQIEQVIVNLAVNARDAISKNGEISLETEIVEPPEEFFASRPELRRGRLICVRVRDNGCGMTSEVKKHLFEPFFTTKEQGKGTGLGLSMVYGTIKQSGGDIEVESAHGEGSVFKLYFPAAEEETPQDSARKTPEQSREGKETVLFVEDEESLRRLGERLLRADGYTVLTAADGKEALAVIERHGKPVDLLMTDVVMPGMSGRELAGELGRRKLARRTLFMSGYTDEAIVKHGVLEPGIAFIYKPFAVEALSAKLREVLDGPADQAKA